MMLETRRGKSAKDSKDQYIERIMEAIIELEITKGHLKWRMSDLSRVSGVTRSLLYYYFGQNKEHLLKQAVQYYTSEFLDFRLERYEKIRRGEIVDLIAISRKRLRKSPYLLQFYAKHRLEKTSVSAVFDQAEKAYFENLRATLPTRWRPFARILWAFVFGLAMQPNLTEEELRTAETIMRRAWPLKRKPHS